MSTSTQERTQESGASIAGTEDPILGISEISNERYQAMLSHIRSSAPPLLQKLQAGLSQLPVELIWAAHPHWPLPSSSPPARQQTVRISVLDSSFNPPTLAHLALANSKRPRYRNEPDGTDYDAKLLLLSVRNADKTLKPGDASYLQRLEMMALLGQDVRTSGEGRNVAIAIIDEPTFAGKSRVLQEYLRTRIQQLAAPTEVSTLSPATVSTQLSFIIGMDTLERVFSPRYYPPPPSDPVNTAESTMRATMTKMLSPLSEGGDDSLIVCAKRGNLAINPAQEKEDWRSTLNMVLAQDPGWMTPLQLHEASRDKGISAEERVVVFDIGDRESKFSSTAVRNARGRLGVVGTESGGGTWRMWVTRNVARYIEEEKLYLL